MISCNVAYVLLYIVYLWLYSSFYVNIEVQTIGCNPKFSIVKILNKLVFLPSKLVCMTDIEPEL